MGAISARYPPAEAAVMAIGAGADLVLFSASPIAAREAVEALAAAVDDGRLDAAQVERSLARVLALRKKFGSKPRASVESIGGAPHATVAEEAARRAVTVVRDPKSVVPLKLGPGDKIFLVQFMADEAAHAAGVSKQTTALGRALATGAARVQEQIRSLAPAGHEYKQLLMAAASADVIIAVTRRAATHELQARAVGDLALAGKPLIVIAAREPFDAAIAPDDAAVIATFGDDDASLAAAVAVILGNATARGVLPVRLSAIGTEPTQAPA
jgi:beta-N-acetylhexosaminidase